MERFVIERFNLEKGETRGGGTAPPTAPSARKNAFFPRNDRPYGLKHNAFQAKNVLFCPDRTGGGTWQSCAIPGDGRHGERVCGSAALHPPDKSAAGEGKGAWGEGLRERLSFVKAGPLARQRPDGGRRPCPLRQRKLRASTAEMRGSPSPQYPFYPIKE